jgi:hypothetical protein
VISPQIGLHRKYPLLLYAADELDSGTLSDRLRSLVVRAPGCRSRDGFDSRRYQISREVMGLEWGPLSLVSTIEELLVRKSSSSYLESREYGCRDPSR